MPAQSNRSFRQSLRHWMLFAFVTLITVSLVGCGVTPEDLDTQPSFKTSSQALSSQTDIATQMEEVCAKADTLMAAASKVGATPDVVDLFKVTSKRCKDLTAKIDNYVIALSDWATSGFNAQIQPCWKKTAPSKNGVGTVPGHCGSRKKIGLLCYDHCKPGYRDVGTACEKPCPRGYTDDGLTCRRPTTITNRSYYYRGRYSCKRGYHQTSTTCYQPCKSGYSGVGNKCVRWAKTVWKHKYHTGLWGSCRSGYRKVFWDCYRNCGSGWRDTGLTCLRPHHEYGRHVYGRNYGRCKSGYSGSGNRCLKNCPSGYRVYWMNHGQCIQTIHIFSQSRYVRAPHTATCNPGETNDAGLCYSCPSNYKPTGPVCYENCPTSHPTTCGFAVCATDQKQCDEFVKDAVVNVVGVALSFLPVGKIASKATSALKSKLAKLGQKYKVGALDSALMKADKLNKKRAETVQALREAAEALSKEIKTTLWGKFGSKIKVFLTKQLANRLDPLKFKESLISGGLKKVMERALKRSALNIAKKHFAEDSTLKDLLVAADPTGIAAVVDTFNKPTCKENVFPPFPTNP